MDTGYYSPEQGINSVPTEQGIDIVQSSDSSGGDMGLPPVRNPTPKPRCTNCTAELPKGHQDKLCLKCNSKAQPAPKMPRKSPRPPPSPRTSRWVARNKERWERLKPHRAAFQTKHGQGRRSSMTGPPELDEYCPCKNCNGEQTLQCEYKAEKCDDACDNCPACYEAIRAKHYDRCDDPQCGDKCRKCQDYLIVSNCRRTPDPTSCSPAQVRLPSPFGTYYTDQVDQPVRSSNSRPIDDKPTPGSGSNSR